jgi:hypothetical protein
MTFVILTIVNIPDEKIIPISAYLTMEFIVQQATLILIL